MINRNNTNQIRIYFNENMTENDMAIAESVFQTRLVSVGCTGCKIRTDKKRIDIEVDDETEIDNIVPVLQTQGVFKMTDSDGNVLITANDVKTVSFETEGNNQYNLLIDFNSDKLQKAINSVKSKDIKYLNMFLDNENIGCFEVTETKYDNIVIKKEDKRDAIELTAIIKSGELPYAPDRVEYDDISEAEE